MKNLSRGNVEKKKWLLRYSELKHDLDRELESARFWHEKAYSISAANLDNLGIHSTTHFDTADYLIKFSELEKNCTQLTYEIQERLKKIEQAIERLESSDQRQVLKMRYLDNYDFPRIAEELHYSLDWIWKLHTKALKKLDIN